MLSLFTSYLWFWLTFAVGNYFAMKILKKEIDISESSKEGARLLSEKKIYQSISNPYIVKLHFSFQSKTKIYMILDFMNGGDLFYHILSCRKIKEKRAVRIASQVLLALKWLHDEDIIYRDLKPMNVLLDKEDNVKLTDFGLSKLDFQSKPEVKQSWCGTVQYLAPEIALGHRYDQMVDWWSFGVVIFEMLCGRLPFDNKNKMACMKNIVTKDFKIPKKLSSNAKDLLLKLLNKDPSERLGSNGVEEIMQHPFFSAVDWDHLTSNDFTELPTKIPKNYQNKCYGHSPKSSVVSEPGSDDDSKIPNFTFVRGIPIKRFKSVM